MESFPIPASVYRLQLSRNFSFSKAIGILPYLKELGIEGVYCSPCFMAASEHGYDVTDPNQVNPALGTKEEYLEFCQTIKKLGLLHIIDVIPNHMGIKKGENRWWQDILENGPYSEFAFFFDINWYPEKKELQGKVLLPLLSCLYGEALEKQEIRLKFANQIFSIHYADYILPLAPHSLSLILANDLEVLRAQFDPEDPQWQEYESLIEHYRSLSVVAKERNQKTKEGRERLSRLLHSSAPIKKHLMLQLDYFNGKKKHPKSFDLLDKLLEAQFYRLAYWRVASHEINYRRFFTVNELVSIRIEDEKVLNSHHRWVFEQLEKDLVQGLRIDHPDGLYDPLTYFQRLRSKRPVFTVVEKILERKERLPENWQIEGTVGYESLNALNGVFIKPEHETAFSELYAEFIGKEWDFDTLLFDSKKIFTDHELASEVEALGLMLDKLAEDHRETRDFTRYDLTRALSAVIASFPVYRTYTNLEGSVSKMDVHFIQVAIAKAKAKVDDLDPSLFDFIESVLLILPKHGPEEETGFRDFTLRFQQLTGPTMAKGLEDTTFFVYNRLISLNEVGGDPRHFGTTLGDFHSFNLEKKQKWPYGFIATSTHDTKRSEDVRMRLNVLSEIPEIWKLELKKWSVFNQKHRKQEVSLNTEYFIYQTLLGAWPSKLKPSKKAEYEQFCERIWQNILKAMREAKQETSWSKPNEGIEEATHSFLLAILESGSKNRFLHAFLDFHKSIDHYGALNSLSQAVLKLGGAGVVDIYQGNEVLNYKLTDPDSRAEVPFDQHQKMLKNVARHSADVLFLDHQYSQLKLLLQQQGLQFRRDHKALFLEGEYIPLRMKGTCQEHVIGYMRTYEQKIAIILAARFFTTLGAAEWDVPLGKQIWKDTELQLPQELQPIELKDLFTSKTHQIKKKGSSCSLSLSAIFETLPVSILYAV